MKMKNYYKVLFIFIFSLYFINCTTEDTLPFSNFLSSATLNPVPGEFTNPLSVELSTTITGATIRYTLDNSTIPSSTIGTIYTTPIWLTQTTTIKHIVYKGGKSSKVISSTYTIKSSSIGDFLESATLNPLPGEFTNPLSVELSTTITGATIRYTLDNSTIPSSTIGTIYTTPIWLTQNTTIKHIVYKDGKSSKVISSTYTIKSSSSLANASIANAALPFTITSSDFTNGGTIPTEFTCDGNNNFPSLNWSTSVPSDTKSFVLLVDADMVLIHLNWSSIPPTTTSIPKIINTNSGDPNNCYIGNSSCASFPSGILGVNGKNEKNWAGPCPGPGTHNYHFTIYALNTTLQELTASDTFDFANNYKANIIEQATIIGRYK